MPRIKVSENVEKITNPGLKSVYRVYDISGKAVADLITKKDEKPDFSKPYRYIDPKMYWKVHHFKDCTIKELQVPIFINGKLVYKPQPIEEIRKYVQEQLKKEIWSEEQRFENPHEHYIDMSPEFYEMKMDLLNKVSRSSVHED